MSVLDRLKFSGSKSIQEFQKEEINPKDLQGQRLSKFWEKGDTVWSVSLKKTKNFFFELFNPNNYSIKLYDTIYYDFIKNRNYLILFGLVFAIPFMVYTPLIYLKMVNVKNLHYLDKIAKRQFIERKFELQTKRISLIDISEDLKKNNFD